MVNKTRSSDDLGELNNAKYVSKYIVCYRKKEDLEDFVSKSKDGKFTLSTYYPYDEESGWGYGVWCAEHWGTKWDVTTEINMVLVAETAQNILLMLLRRLN